MSFGSRSRTQQTQDIDSTTTAIEDVDGRVIIGGSGSITVQDPSPSIASDAFDLGGEVIRATERGLDRALDFGVLTVAAAGQAGAAAQQTARQAVAASERATRSDASLVLNNLVRFGAIGAVVIGIVFILNR